VIFAHGFQGLLSRAELFALAGRDDVESRLVSHARGRWTLAQGPFRAADLGIAAARSQILLAKANAKVDVNGEYAFSHVAGSTSASLFANFDLPFFNRNQGEIARTGYALTQAEEQQRAASDTVVGDVSNAYEGLRSNDEVVQLYTSGYLKQAQDSRDISEYAYKRGAASLLDFLDAERSYRSVQLAYRQALASYMTSLEQLKEAVGTRSLP